MLRKLAVDAMPMSGTPAELMAWTGIDADAIVRTAQEVLVQQRLWAGSV